MKVLICSAIPLDRTTANLNRLTRMQQSLEMHQVHARIVGFQSGLGVAWKEVVMPCGNSAIAFDPKLTGAKGYCNAIRQGAQAANFYRSFLPDLVKQFQVDGVIAYHPQGQTVGAILDAGHASGCFVVADMVELFRLNSYYFFNGTNYQQYRLRRNVLPNVDGVIGISHGWCDWCDQRGIRNVWCPSFALDQPSRELPTPKGNPFVLAVAGQWNSREMPMAFLAAVEICVSRGLDVRLRVVGNTGKSRQQRVAMQMVQSSGQLKDRVEFTGFIKDPKDFSKAFLDADAFILLRNDTLETNMLFPTRLPEFMVTGNPVVLSEVGCFSQCFEHRVDVSFVSPDNDPEDIADEIEFLIKNPDKRHTIGQNGRRKMLEEFSLATLGRRLTQFLKETQIRSDLGSRNGGPSHA
ncbi:glycosyltransferase [Mariniblastus fucicola]|uniref:Glycosyl transferases group 1 n=2 Tax=Mariniblastus fucicola TaxID=980251 RepID=A0A5B9P562_9BACT|nr:glycosyltransferase [Mariniblastus fucicola]QEG20295.1 Glycosyl transferases group 1 [Mariniblastus fucicola]